MRDPMGAASTPRRRWPNLLPLVVALVVIAEVVFLVRLDIAKNASMVQHWTTTFQFPSTTADFEDSLASSFPSFNGSLQEEVADGEDEGRCEDWLEREDAIPYSRSFTTDPIIVSGGEKKDWSTCSVGCQFGNVLDRTPDATFNLPRTPLTASVHRSMESSKYYMENQIEVARGRGYDILMTTSLSSDVPVGYFSWAEYDIMAPMHPKTEKAHAAAFISNCGARNFRLQALEMLENFGIQIDSYGACHKNRDENVDKVEALKHYKFSLAFENSNEEDYVTEKFFQSLVAGAIPVVVGAPNIQEFAPSPSSVLHIKELDDVESVAKTMKFLATNLNAYNKSVSWKHEGPSDSFKALVDMAAVHSSCRLCIFLATKIRDKEEMTTKFQKRPCKCTTMSGTVYHLYVRERGRFHMESVFLRSGMLTLEGMEAAVLSKFKSLNHTPVWRNERPKSIRGGDDLKIYRIYPVGLTQRQALYNFKFDSDDDFRKHVESNPCAKFEVIFV
ncbi:glycoprotein 3-alpha-L-fucosyltransferase A-like [Zingiber officinale]|uniref:glycoprotein 3-alpha-L-fucosyltransferase A-like n=1 Tax=Zingiber officinale TaxID=94328 RepID=UPI001C4D0B35|nr:glycoprotein 3-alpha-L-fucosyltransferase A-like [Zingiber officinale]